MDVNIFTSLLEHGTVIRGVLGMTIAHDASVDCLIRSIHSFSNENIASAVLHMSTSEGRVKCVFVTEERTEFSVA
jgi:hypothetical protein